MNDTDTKGIDLLTEKIKQLPQKLQTKITRTILRDALKQTNAREDLISYIKSHFKSRTGIYQSSVSAIKTGRVRSDRNKIISYIYFLPVSKIGKGKNTQKSHIPPRTLTHWLNAGTRAHAIGKGSRLKQNESLQKISENRYQIAINNAKLNLLKAKTEKQKAKFSGAIERNTKKLSDLKSRGSRKNTQNGTAVKGITARHFMEKIQNQVSSNAAAIVAETVQDAISDLLK